MKIKGEGEHLYSTVLQNCFIKNNTEKPLYWHVKGPTRCGLNRVGGFTTPTTKSKRVVKNDNVLYVLFFVSDVLLNPRFHRVRLSTECWSYSSDTLTVA